MLSGPLPNVGNSLIVADSYLRNLYQLELDSGNVGQLLPFGVASSPRAVTYDQTGRLVYWTDLFAHTINRHSLVTRNNTVIYRDPNNTGEHIDRTYTST